MPQLKFVYDFVISEKIISKLTSFDLWLSHFEIKNEKTEPSQNQIVLRKPVGYIKCVLDALKDEELIITSHKRPINETIKSVFRDSDKTELENIGDRHYKFKNYTKQYREFEIKLNNFIKKIRHLNDDD